MPALLTQMTALCGIIRASPSATTNRRRRILLNANASTRTGVEGDLITSSISKEPLLLRVARGEQGDGPPVWLMRQAGRYMAEFREYSNKYGFRHRSETPEIAIELSLQPWRAFKPDGVIMFSDILTPLPAIGVEFDVVKVRIFIRSVSNGTPTFPFHKYVLLVADLT